MNLDAGEPVRGYDTFYREFDSPLMRELRREAYGEDIGQHSWVSADEIRADMQRLRLSRSSRLLDLGCGPCGPLIYVLSTVGCSGVGVELSAAALEAGRARALASNVDHQLEVHESDLDQPLPLKARSCNAAMSLDVVLHVRDRRRFYEEVARVLAPGGRFLVTDAGVVTGSVSNGEIRRRSVHGHAQFAPRGWNETLLETAGFRLIETENRTESLRKNAGGRRAAMLRHRAELEQVSGAEEVRSQLDYLETVVELAERGALSRFMYLAEVHGQPAG